MEETRCSRPAFVVFLNSKRGASQDSIGDSEPEANDAAPPADAWSASFTMPQARNAWRASFTRAKVLSFFNPREFSRPTSKADWLERMSANAIHFEKLYALKLIFLLVLVYTMVSPMWMVSSTTWLNMQVIICSALYRGRFGALCLPTPCMSRPLSSRSACWLCCGAAHCARRARSPCVGRRWVLAFRTGWSAKTLLKKQSRQRYCITRAQEDIDELQLGAPPRIFVELPADARVAAEYEASRPSRLRPQA